MSISEWNRSRYYFKYFLFLSPGGGGKGAWELDLSIHAQAATVRGRLIIRVHALPFFPSSSMWGSFTSRPTSKASPRPAPFFFLPYLYRRFLRCQYFTTYMLIVWYWYIWYWRALSIPAVNASPLFFFLAWWRLEHARVMLLDIDLLLRINNDHFFNDPTLEREAKLPCCMILWDMYFSTESPVILSLGHSSR